MEIHDKYFAELSHSGNESFRSASPAAWTRRNNPPRDFRRSVAACRFQRTPSLRPAVAACQVAGGVDVGPAHIRQLHSCSYSLIIRLFARGRSRVAVEDPERAAKPRDFGVGRPRSDPAARAVIGERGSCGIAASQRRFGHRGTRRRPPEWTARERNPSLTSVKTVWTTRYPYQRVACVVRWALPSHSSRSPRLNVSDAREVDTNAR